MMLRQWTQIQLGLIIVYLIFWDGIVDLIEGNPATISAVIRDAVIAEPMLAVAIGVCLGHWFWPQAR